MPDLDPVRLGQTGLTGWRARVGDLVAPRLARHTPLDDDQGRALLGALFFALSTLYVVSTVRRVARS